ncbi:MAG: ABC transporter permease [Bryobacteraceae bacterium]|nr:ABC transporter permease [Bryobacteraceae bacterium]
MTRWLAAYAAAAYAFLHLPLLVLAAFSVNSAKSAVWERFSWKWYAEAFADRQLMEASANSLAIAIAAAVLSTVIGTLAAYGMWKRRSPVMAGSLYLSLVTPEIVWGVALLAFFQGLFRFLDVRLGLHTVIAAHVAFSIAYVVVVVLARLRTFDPALEEAAMDLGATEWQAFWRVTLPGIAPGVIAGALLAFTVSMDDYVITSLVAGVDSETLPMAIYAAARRGVSPALNAISTVIVFGLGVLIVVSERLQRS